MCLIGFLVQFSDHLWEIHSREAEGDTGDTSQQAESCSHFLPAYRPTATSVGAGKDRQIRTDNSQQAEAVTGGTAAHSHSSGHHILVLAGFVSEKAGFFQKKSFLSTLHIHSSLRLLNPMRLTLSTDFGLAQQTFVIIPKFSFTHNHHLCCPAL